MQCRKFAEYLAKAERKVPAPELVGTHDTVPPLPSWP
jgi:hypothetical protein